MSYTAQDVTRAAAITVGTDLNSLLAEIGEEVTVYSSAGTDLPPVVVFSGMLTLEELVKILDLSQITALFVLPKSMYVTGIEECRMATVTIHRGLLIIDNPAFSPRDGTPLAGLTVYAIPTTDVPQDSAV